MTMTNNPTIDGVSRELIHTAVSALQEEGRWDIADRLELAISAPAVERQELKPAARICGAGYDEKGSNVWMEIGVEEMPITRRVELGEKLIFMADAQSTIAQLQARVQELESGRGEPVAWVNGEQLKLCAASPREVQPNNPMMHNLPRNIAGSALKTYYCNTPLYAAPPAPAEVVLPASESLRDLITKAARDADLIPGANYYTAAELAASALLDKIKELNP